MGCWNGTDCITGMPIFAEDPIRMLALKQGSVQPSLGSGFCYPYEMWYPIAPAISGLYDDYGCIMDIKDDAVARYLFQTLPISEEAKEEVHDYADDLVGKLSAVERGVVKIPLTGFMEDHDIDSGLVEWMVHEKTWDLLLDMKLEFYSNGSIEERAQVLKGIVEECGVEGKDRSGWESDVLIKWQMRAEISRLIDFNSPSRGFFNDALYWAIKMSCSSEMIDAIAEVQKVTWLMGSLRRYFAPIAGAGSQCEELEKHRALAEMVLNQCDEKIEKNKDRGW